MVRRKFLTSPDDNDDESLFRDWAPWESTILSYFLFRPMGMSLRPVSSSIEANLEEGMELLIERLAVPNLWLQPDLISSEYIKDLPLWHYRDSHSDNSTSDSEETALSESCEEKSDECPPKSVETSHASTSTSSLQVDETEAALCSPSPRLHKRSMLGTKAQARCEQKQKARRDVSPEATAPSGVLHCKDCAICLEPYRRKQLICGLPCGHNYHEACIMSWLYRDNHCCPKCRWPTYKQRPKLG